MVIIYFDETKVNKQVIKPSNKFDGNYLDLVLHVTHSCLDKKNYVKNYHSFEIV